MKKLSLFLVTLLLMAAVTMGVGAVEDVEYSVMDNNIFYAELPQGYELNNEYENQRFYFQNKDYDSFEFYVEGNILFPKGIAQTPDSEIQKRIKAFYEMDTLSILTVDTASKKIVNGLVCYLITAQTDDGMFTEPVSMAVFTTKENAVMIVHTGSDSEEYDTAHMTQLLNTFTMNGTYFAGDKPTLNHSFKNAPDYYDTYEQFVLSGYTGNDELNDVASGIFAWVLIIPIVFIALITFMVLYFRTKKELDNYKKQGYIPPQGGVTPPYVPYTPPTVEQPTYENTENN